MDLISPEMSSPLHFAPRWTMTTYQLRRALQIMVFTSAWNCQFKWPLWLGVTQLQHCLRWLLERKPTDGWLRVCAQSSGKLDDRLLGVKSFLWAFLEYSSRFSTSRLSVIKRFGDHAHVCKNVRFCFTKTKTEDIRIDLKASKFIPGAIVAACKRHTCLAKPILWRPAALKYVQDEASHVFMVSLLEE